MAKRGIVGLAVLAAAAVATFGSPSQADAHGYRRYYSRPVAYPAYRSYYHNAPVVYSTPVYYSAPVYSTPVVYSRAPVVYSRPAYYSTPYYYTPSGFSFGYYGGHGHNHGGVSVRVGF